MVSLRRPRSAVRYDSQSFAHGADIGIRGVGPSKEASFEQVAQALTSVITDPRGVVPRTPIRITCEAPSDDLLLLDWLNAVIFEMATRRMLFSSFVVRIDGAHLRATAWGESVDRRRHQPAVEVKGATCTELRVEELPDGHWLSQCVVDV